VLTKGLDDFWAMPTHVVFISLMYPVVGFVLGVATLGLGHNPASDLYPLGAGFPLIGHRSLRAEPAGANSVSTHPGSMRSMWSTQSP
jgi:uncharacterized membrane protein